MWIRWSGSQLWPELVTLTDQVSPINALLQTWFTVEHISTTAGHGTSSSSSSSYSHDSCLPVQLWASIQRPHWLQASQLVSSIPLLTSTEPSLPPLYRAVYLLGRQEEVDIERELHRIYRLVLENQESLLELKGEPHTHSTPSSPPPSLCAQT